MGKKNFIIFILLIALICSGCGRQEEKEWGQFNPVPVKKREALTVLTNKNMRTDNWECPTKDGCYSAKYAVDANKGCNLFFTDYKAQKRVYLSSSVNGDYWNENDTSYLKSANAVSLCQDGNYLYAYAYEMLEDDSFQYVMYKMDLDGQNRKELFRTGEMSEISGGIVCDSEYLYFLNTEIRDGREIDYICAADKNDGGDIHKIYGFEANGDWHFLTSAFDRKVVIKTIVTDEDIEKQEHKILVFDIDTGKITEAMSWKQGEIEEIYNNEYVYYADIKSGCIVSKNISDGTEQILWSDIPLAEKTATDISLNAQLYDDDIFLIVGGKRYALNVKTKEIKALTLMEEGNNEEQKYITVLGSSEDAFYVVAGKGQRRVAIKNPQEGMPNEEIIDYDKYAMIKKEDFYNNRPNYIMIEDMEIDKDSIVS